MEDEKGNLIPMLSNVEVGERLAEWRKTCARMGKHSSIVPAFENGLVIFRCLVCMESFFTGDAALFYSDITVN